MDEAKTLARMECEPCRGGTPPLKGAALRDLHKQLSPGWEVVDEHHLRKEYSRWRSRTGPGPFPRRRTITPKSA